MRFKGISAKLLGKIDSLPAPVYVRFLLAFAVHIAVLIFG